MSDAAPSPTAATDTANLHLQWGEQFRTVPVTFQRGAQTVRELLPIARELTHQITAMAVESAEREARSISCRAGCGACCRQLVVISLVDAQSLADLVASLPPDRQAVIRGRFDAAIRRLEEAGLLDPHEAKGNRRLVSDETQAAPWAIRAVAARYFRQQIPCPFLENESCSIYADRPLVCREYLVTSPAERCARLYEVPIDPLELPIHMGDVLVHVGHEMAGADKEAIPLVLALEWAEAHPGALARKADGIQWLQAMMGQIDRQWAENFEERSGGTERHEEPPSAGKLE
jgi:Fe-S-cluster containining protein